MTAFNFAANPNSSNSYGPVLSLCSCIVSGWGIRLYLPPASSSFLTHITRRFSCIWCSKCKALRLSSYLPLFLSFNQFLSATIEQVTGNIVRVCMFPPERRIYTFPRHKEVMRTSRENPCRRLKYKEPQVVVFVFEILIVFFEEMSFFTVCNAEVILLSVKNFREKLKRTWMLGEDMWFTFLPSPYFHPPLCGCPRNGEMPTSFPWTLQRSFSFSVTHKGLRMSGALSLLQTEGGFDNS